MIYGDRIRQAREYSGFTQTELAKRVGVNQSAIAHLESDRNIPTEDLLTAIAEQTGFMPPFFFKEPANDFPIGTLAFRARNSLTNRELNKAYQHANVLFEYVLKMAEKFHVPPVNLPEVNEDPAKAALITRETFGLSPNTPIRNMMLTIEKNGVFILALPIVLRKIDAFSTWANISRPVIVVSSGKPSDRTRFSIAHELGHLIMHRVKKGRIVEMENKANNFAAEFLLPEKAMRLEIHLPVTLTSMARLKPRWGVSIQALIRRSRDLDIITARQYRYLFEQLSQRGWRVNEPTNLDIPKEKPRLVQKMIEQLYENSNIIELMAKDVNLSKEKTVELINKHIEKEHMPILDYQATTEQIGNYTQN